MAINFRNTILLTGAGFTANFGGFLSREMWFKIFNNPRLSSAGNVKLELKKNFNFEEVYSKVFDGRFPFPDEGQVLTDVVNETYIEMDSVLMQFSSENNKVHPSDMRRFLEYFASKNEERVGGCFTLNQDLYLERMLGWQPLGPASMRYRGTFGNLDNEDLDPRNPKALPSEGEVEVYKSQSYMEDFCFVKLHGSLGWVTHDRGESKVMGINKIETIINIPLLKWYFELFQQALHRSGVRLLVIGYGFGDKHINECISEGAENHGFKIYVISLEQPESFHDRLVGKPPPGSGRLWDPDPIGIRIWKAVDGYFPYRLSDVFPQNQSQTAARREISRVFDAAL